MNNVHSIAVDEALGAVRIMTLASNQVLLEKDSIYNSGSQRGGIAADTENNLNAC